MVNVKVKAACRGQQAFHAHIHIHVFIYTYIHILHLPSHLRPPLTHTRVHVERGILWRAHPSVNANANVNVNVPYIYI